MLDSLQQENKAIGIKQTNKALNQDKVKILYLAQDADTHLVERLVDIANKKNIEIIYVDSMKKLGKACGIDVSAAAAATLK
ncbi:ribosomal L7Ae/L30e/S12e/Gadd45 family protein [Natronincola ferrireducens]|uniref:Large subunit ribosomal protein L7A n=1 Tax=Natronincola ferrireducens TaxID=393762 RepID=A0A1G9J4S3_9FIRM|nr:ribosomal L7Ae/L30e/S12e/Gadd45 family protein [Natronincola ferrireducens]SDL32246.1 large subunit ribosomal protein L7A [Natronincola ferrireducens]